jgi:hypothetical protein
MPTFAPTRVLSLLSRFGVGIGVGITLCAIALCTTARGQLQTQRPHQAPTAIPATSQTTSGITAQPTPVSVLQPATAPTHRADVTYTFGLLTVSASNSSLNQILREIGRITAMKITGGVNDERVFGIYGPDTPAKVLTALLDGTGSNLLIIQSPAVSPAAPPVELVLTPRHGGPTPPNPSAPGYNDANDAESENPPPSANDSPFRRATNPSMTNAGAQPPPSDSNVSPPPPIAPTDTPAATTPAATTQEQSPNGIKTPQQIYEQLLRLRNQAQPPPQ